MINNEDADIYNQFNNSKFLGNVHISNSGNRVNLPEATILSDFKVASIHLSNWKNEFGHLENTHIKRRETTTLFDWINQPLKPNESCIKLVVGSAGMGKSVIMKDLYHLLLENNIPVLGLKSDKLLKENLEALRKQLNFKATIQEQVEILGENSQTVVCIIDQLDALSQSLSLRRDFLIVYQQLIEQLKFCRADVRIIISTREFDLKIDRRLNTYQTHNNVVKVSLLSENEVKNVIGKIMSVRELSNSLLELLRTPSHLNIFCKVYRPKLRLDKIKTLKDLYDEHWKQVIEKIPNEADVSSANCKDLVFEMAVDMYNENSPNLTQIDYWKDYSKEIAYLQSTGFLVGLGDELQFLHQSLYDYVFAKQFISGDISIFDYIKENHQGLFIRASLKMIIQFLRDDRKRKEYFDIYNTILFSAEYRFHLKDLLISLLGAVKSPTANEKRFVRNKILTSTIYQKLFIEVTLHVDWLKMILQSTCFNQLVLGKEEYRDTDLWSSTLKRFLYTETNIVLEYIHQIDFFVKRQSIISWLLFCLDDWKNPLAIELYKKYYNDYSDLVVFENMLNRPELIEFVLNEYYEKFQLRLNDVEKNFIKGKDIDYEFRDKSFFEKLFKIDRERAFDFALQIAIELIEKTKYDWEKEEVFYGDSMFNGFSLTEKRHYDQINDLLLEMVNSLKYWAEHNKERFIIFCKQHIHSNSKTLLKITMHVLARFPKNNIDLIFEFMLIFHQKGGWLSYENLRDGFDDLFFHAYPYLSNTQKRQINQLVMSLETSKEKQSIKYKNYKRRVWHDYSKFDYLTLYTEDELTQYPKMKRLYQELIRRGGYKARGKSFAGGLRVIQPRLHKQAYDKMNSIQWEKSMLRYNEEVEIPFGSVIGSLHAHSDQFRDAVKAKPTYFYPLIQQLIEKNQVQKIYILRGLQGLAETKHDVKKFKKLFEVGLHLLKDEYQTEIIRLDNFLLKKKSLSDVVFNQIISWSKEKADTSRHKEALERIKKYRPNQQKDDNLVSIGAYHYVGDAILHIMNYYDYPEYENLIFDTLNEISHSNQIEILACVLHRLAKLTKMNRKKTLQVFLKITANHQHGILLHHGIWSSQYLCRYNFEAISPYFQKATEYEKSQKDITTILAIEWIHGEEKARPLLDELLAKNAKNKAELPKVATYFIQPKTKTEKEPRQERCKELFLVALNEEDEDIFTGYSQAFHKLETVHFSVMYPLLKEFIKSKVAPNVARSFYKYLIKCLTSYPKKCLGLMKYAPLYEETDSSKSSYYDKEPIEVLLGVYDVLNGTEEDNIEFIHQVLDIYDAMLRNPKQRKNAKDMIESIEI